MLLDQLLFELSYKNTETHTNTLTDSDEYCGKWRKNSKSGRDLAFEQTMPNVELVRDISIYMYVLQYVSS